MGCDFFILGLHWWWCDGP